MTDRALFPEPTCTCGHPYVSHHLTARHNATYCTVWSPKSCPCTKFTQQEEDTE